MTAGLLTLAAAAGMVTGSFDCSIDQVAAVSVADGKATASMIDGLPADALKFRMSFKKEEATIDWANSPIQANGKQSVLPTAQDAGMIMILSGGPCLFTEGACASMFNFAKQPDGSLKLLVTPTAVSFDQDRKTRFPFLVSMTGICSPSGASK